MKKDLLSLNELSEKDINEILDLAIDIKKNIKKYENKLKGKTLAMLFEKPSTRTRGSFECGFAKLGGFPSYIDWKSTQLGKARVKDEIQCMGRYYDIIMARVKSHKTLIEMAKNTDVPIINGLSDLYHPCQILADLMTIKEKKGQLEKVTLAFIGDGNNVCNSLIIGCKKTGIKIKVACPKGYEPKETPDMITNDPKKAAKGADIVYTDTWVSMGQEAEKDERLNDFKGFMVTKDIIGKALFMHCLPAYIGYEVAKNVFESKQSIVFDQAENRMWVQMAVILKLLKV